MLDTLAALPEFIDLAIVGAGPHALTLATHLLQKKKSMRGRFLAFDPSGTWMSQWDRQFAAFEIPHLRSPAVHQPDPDPHALRTFAAPRPDELFAPYDLPGTQLFRDFCQEMIQRWQLADCVYPAQVIRVEPCTDRGRARFCLHLANGQTMIARRVVIANGGAVRNVPEWVGQISTSYPPDRVLHSQQIDLRGSRLQGERVLIIGGGLTSGHLALGAVERGAQVLLMSRRDVYGKLFDADPGWIGPKYLKGFWAEPDLHTRWQMIQQARNGGSMTPMVLSQLRRLEREGKVMFYEQCGVSQAEWSDDSWQVHCDNSAVHECIHHQSIDRIWVATGSQLDARNHPLLQDVLAAHPLEIVNGLPVVDEYLRWQGCELFIMGGLAALRVGPAARNLSGARAASDRIVPALTKSSLALMG
ncbi:SidA/IucD/PvdA family monooxygenase [Chamaesiphon sp. VAR_48_metabat_135_sub]|uniref:FAD/NAD(P)-binding protein n=1 Tax=Chamaesiphon sp. VAR_48_metabat_135_sub TaxID=2964699 RepID=UPI00286B142C|nr:SidA/IucD/PvdA family monooxygenase [Chamaesiphon sp. VAR_48_metabat_135_sub]